MTSYNLINGVRASECEELITGILRGDWGYEGLVITDWVNHASRTKEVLAGNDVHMPSNNIEKWYKVEKAPEEIEGVERNKLAVCVKRLLETILWFE